MSEITTILILAVIVVGLFSLRIEGYPCCCCSLHSSWLIAGKIDTPGASGHLYLPLQIELDVELFPVILLQGDNLMILLMDNTTQHRCDAIRINLLSQKFADDSSSMETKEEIVQSARQMGSYIVTMKSGVVETLIDPNKILAILPNR